MSLLELAEQVTGAFGYRARDTSDLGHMNAVGAIGAAGAELMQKDHFALVLHCRHVQIDEAR
jgi:outer membrane protein W